MTAESNPIARGTTGYAGAAINAAALQFQAQLGQQREFPDANPDPNATTLTTKTNLRVKAILVRNTTGAPLLPKDAVRIHPTDPSRIVAAKVSSSNQFWGVVDEYLPPAGVPNNDVFWMIVGGPTTVKATGITAQAAGGVPVQSSASSGMVALLPAVPADATAAQNAGIFGSQAFTEGAVALAATEIRVYMNNKFFGY